jgi:hypothetical protein
MNRPAWLQAAPTYRAIVIGGLLLSLALNLPGHLTADSVIALNEARTGVRQTWAPAVSSWLLGIFDQALSGAGLYVTASAALLFLAWASLASLRPRASWLSPLVAVPVMLLPQVLVYQGIVWRDVLFANLACAGFIFLAHAAARWGVRAKWPPLVGALICFALAALVRQNGLVIVLLAGLALGWTASSRGWRAGVAWGLGGLAATAVLAAGINIVAQPGAVAPKLRPNSAALILQHYDIVGARAHDPSVRFEIVGAADPNARRILETRAPQLYTPARIDTLDQEEAVRRALWRLPDAAMSAQWREVVLHQPSAYLKHRADVFWWTLATPALDQCLPVAVGVTGPPDMVGRLGMVVGVERQDRAALHWAERFYGTPAYSHLAYAGLALAVLVLLLLRRDPADMAIATLMVAALGFAASFFVISVACDYRYLYPLDLAALTGLLYVALDPLTWRKRT